MSIITRAVHPPLTLNRGCILSNTDVAGRQAQASDSCPTGSYRIGQIWDRQAISCIQQRCTLCICNTFFCIVIHGTEYILHFFHVYLSGRGGLEELSDLLQSLPNFDRLDFSCSLFLYAFGNDYMVKNKNQATTVKTSYALSIKMILWQFRFPVIWLNQLRQQRQMIRMRQR